MYKVYDKFEAIRQIQLFLSKTNKNIYVAPTGVYDTNTKDAVIVFQKKIGLLPTGIVNKETFDALYIEYLNSQLSEKATFNIELPLRQGMVSDDLIQVNRILSELMNYYGYTHRLRHDNYFSKETEKAAKILSTIYLLSYPGFIDNGFYRMLIGDYASVKH